jgi:hypothetical protein
VSRFTPERLFRYCIGMFGHVMRLLPRRDLEETQARQNALYGSAEVTAR